MPTAIAVPITKTKIGTNDDPSQIARITAPVGAVSADATGILQSWGQAKAVIGSYNCKVAAKKIHVAKKGRSVNGKRANNDGSV